MFMTWCDFMKKILGLCVLLGFGLGGCEKSEQEKLDEKRAELDIKMQNLVRDSLKDGDSAKFRNHYELCGEVNAKNSFGAYTGYSKYVITPDKIYFESDYSESDFSKKLFKDLWDSACIHGKK